MSYRHNFLVLPMRQSLFYFSGAKKFCLADGLRQLTRCQKSKVTSKLLMSEVTSLMHHHGKYIMAFKEGRYAT